MRVIMRDGVPWFVLADLCRVLEIANVGNAAARLDDDERGSIRNPDVTPAGGNSNITIVNESGMWSLVLTSRKPEAKRFKKWVTGEVLPRPAEPDLTPQRARKRTISTPLEIIYCTIHAEIIQRA